MQRYIKTTALILAVSFFALADIYPQGRCYCGPWRDEQVEHDFFGYEFHSNVANDKFILKPGDSIIYGDKKILLNNIYYDVDQWGVYVNFQVCFYVIQRKSGRKDFYYLNERHNSLYNIDGLRLFVKEVHIFGENNYEVVLRAGGKSR